MMSLLSKVAVALTLPLVMLAAKPVEAATADQLAAGYNHVCARTSTGGIQCWGSNNLGQLGDGTTTNSSTPVSVSGLSSNVAWLAAGYQHNCVVMADGTARCWGRNDFGQLGNGTLTASSVPVTVTGLTGVVSISAGITHSCAVLSSGGVKCWGKNNNGAVGDGTPTNRSTPANVLGITTALAVATGGDHSCAYLSNHTVRCWGLNGNGQLGNGTQTTNYTSVAVSGLVDAASITAGQYHTCSRTTSGGAQCWGAYSVGQLGNGMSGGGSAVVSTPSAVTGLGGTVTFLQASNSGGSTCAILNTGAAQCWGYNGQGQLGTGDKLNRSNPANVTGLSGSVLTMSIGGTVACASVASTPVSASCWGGNNVGQQGAGNTSAVNFPQQVVGF